ncbi:MAG: hypothetical protein MUF01_05465 [Bryobacterales bacterium]|nr:hypothetical protein [Bryobacterales bacterium]
MQFSRRGWLRTALCGGSGLGMLSLPAAAQRGLYFENVRWYAWRPGRDEAAEWLGILQINANTQRMSFFHKHSTMLDIPFANLGNVDYEYAAQPKEWEIPAKGWPRMKKKQQKHFLKIVYREARRALNVETAADTNFMVVKTLLEMPEASYAKVIEALEEASGIQVRK